MDFSTVLGILAFAGLLFLGISENQITSSLVIPHGVFVVLGGVFVAMLINTPLKYLIKSVTEMKTLMFEDETAQFHKSLAALVALAEQCRMRGLSALKDTDRGVADGFLARAADA